MHHAPSQLYPQYAGEPAGKKTTCRLNAQVGASMTDNVVHTLRSFGATCAVLMIRPPRPHACIYGDDAI